MENYINYKRKLKHLNIKDIYIITHGRYYIAKMCQELAFCVKIKHSNTQRSMHHSSVRVQALNSEK